MKKILLLTSLVILTSLVVYGVVYISNQTQTYTFAYIQDNNVFIVNDQNEETQITTSDEWNYSKLASLDGEIAYLKCNQQNQNTCILETYDYENDTFSQTFDFTEVEQFQANSFTWSPDASYFTYFTPFTAYLTETNGKTKELISWDILDLGFGGLLCNGFEFSPNSDYFTFCKGSAVGVDIQGQLFLFNSEGNLLKTFDTNTQQISLGINYPIFVDDTKLLYQDLDNNKTAIYNLDSKETNETSELFGSNPELSKDGSFVRFVEDPYNPESKLTYLNLNTLEKVTKKPDNVVFKETNDKEKLYL